MVNPKSTVILLAFVFVCSLNEALAIKCYTCESVATGSCRNPAGGSSIVCRSPAALSKLEALLSIPTAVNNVVAEVNANFNNLVSDDGTKNLDENDALAMDCGTINGNDSSGRSIVVRSCLVQQITCQVYAQYLWEQIRFRVISCIRCNQDLCNTH